jgi:hypothetical protein
MQHVTEINGVDSSPDKARAWAPLTAAERMARYRERRKAGMRCLTLEIRNSEISALIRRGLLDSNKSNDRVAIKTAIYAYFEQTLDLVGR